MPVGEHACHGHRHGAGQHRYRWQFKFQELACMVPYVYVHVCAYRRVSLEMTRHGGIMHDCIMLLSSIWFDGSPRVDREAAIILKTSRARCDALSHGIYRMHAPHACKLFLPMHILLKLINFGVGRRPGRLNRSRSSVPTAASTRSACGRGRWWRPQRSNCRWGGPLSGWRCAMPSFSPT